VGRGTQRCEVMTLGPINTKDEQQVYTNMMVGGGGGHRNDGRAQVTGHWGGMIFGVDNAPSPSMLGMPRSTTGGRLAAEGAAAIDASADTCVCATQREEQDRGERVHHSWLVKSVLPPPTPLDTAIPRAPHATQEGAPCSPPTLQYAPHTASRPIPQHTHTTPSPTLWETQPGRPKSLDTCHARAVPTPYCTHHSKAAPV
jgi:hypothetical protein